MTRRQLSIWSVPMRRPIWTGRKLIDKFEIKGDKFLSVLGAYLFAFFKLKMSIKALQVQEMSKSSTIVAQNVSVFTSYNW